MKKYLSQIYNRVSSLWYRARIHNDNFTIITNTCIGGIMYHKLGKRFMSPTINLWMEDPDFFKFVRDLDTYMQQPLRFVQGIDATPTAYCGDVLIHFNHYKSEAEAEEKWIFPYSENADVMFNSALNIEFAVLRNYAEPILASVPRNCAEYSEAHRLLKFIHYFVAIPDNEIPPTSIMREFVGGSSFKYKNSF